MSLSKLSCIAEQLSRRLKTALLCKKGGGGCLPEEQAFGKPLVTTRWEPQQREGSVKVRFVAREFAAGDPRDDVFAPASCPLTARVIDTLALRGDLPTAVLDATAAYYQAPETEECYVNPPLEFLRAEAKAGRSTNVKWKLLKQLPGRRRAGQAWVDHVAAALVREPLCLERCAEMPCFFGRRRGQIAAELHMDDMHLTGEPDPLNKVIDQISGEIVCEASPLYFAGGGGAYTYLKRTRVRSEAGTWLIPSPRYVASVLGTLGLGGCAGAPTPMTEASAREETAENQLLDAAAHHVYRSAVGSAAYLALDRLDTSFAVKALSRDLAAPTLGSQRRLKRLGRYLKETADWATWLPKPAADDDEAGGSELAIFTDSDWAGDRLTRRSTSGAFFSVAGVPQGGYSKLQTVVAQSSAEAEYYAAAGGVSEGVLLQKVYGFFNWQLTMRLHMDATAAKGIMARQGVGRIRHLETRTLWLQTLFKERRLEVLKILGTENPIDMATKALPREKLYQCARRCGIYPLSSDPSAEKAAKAGADDESKA